MAALFLVTLHFETAYPLLGWVRSFAEAAMVGALADWFAVVALFRRPMGLPIPHTAIVPRNKDRIGDNLASFVETNFLAPDVVREKVAGVDFVGSLAEWVLEGDRPHRLAALLARRLPELLDRLDREDIYGRLGASLRERVESIELAPIAGELLAVATANGRHHPVVDQLVDELARLVSEHEPAIRAKVREKTAWLWRSLGTDVAISDKIIAAAEETIAEIGRDRQHPWRRKLDELLAGLAQDLKTSEHYRRALETLKVELLRHPALHGYMAALLDDLLAAIRADVARQESVIARVLEQGIASFAGALAAEEPARAPLNRWLRGAIVRVAEAQRHEVGRLIADTIRAWDPQTFTDRIESYVGEDLQYIRINGTIIGGLVGLAIRAVSLTVS